MISNISLEITALVFILFVLIHFLREKKLNDTSNKVFTFFIYLGIVDIILDVVATILLEKYAGEFITATKLSLTLLYLVQSMLPYAFVQYVYSFLEVSRASRRKTMKFYCAGMCLMQVLIIANYFSGMFFYYDAASVYHHGPLYFLMYLYAGFYLICVAIISVRHKQELKDREFGCIWEYLFVLMLGVVIQYVTGVLLTIGVAIALGLNIFYITVNNPSNNLDPVTGVPDRVYFTRWMEERVAKGQNVNIIAIELTKLKWLNKIYGAKIADNMLRVLARMLAAQVRNGRVFRTSDKRFVIELDNKSEYGKALDVLYDEFEKKIPVAGEYVKLPVVLCGVPDAERFGNTGALMQYIDYISDNSPESDGTVMLCDSDKMMAGFRREQEWEKFVDVAIEEELFNVYYQPVYSAESGKMITVEVLSRLEHPVLGPISPMDFISIAERNGQIDKIGLMQFRKVCQFVKANEHIMERIKNVKFNLSPQELLKKGQGKALIDTIEELGLKPSYFNFEITETVATEYSDAVMDAINMFRDAGIELCLDDFGSGYANLNTVLKMPFSIIKLDRSLLDGILEDPAVADFYEKIVTILHGMGYEIVAEGVETEEEFKRLTEWQVDMIQGYYFSRPVSEDKLLEMIG